MRTIRKPSIPCWVAVFKEVTKDTKTGVNIIGFDLFNRQGPGISHYFPREDWATCLYPIEKPQNMLDGLLYPIRSERRFFVERFLVTLKVTDYKINEKENRLDALDLKVEFKNPI